VISTIISTDRGIAPGTSRVAAGCRVRTAATVVNPAIYKTADHRVLADRRASVFGDGQVWIRPATADVLVPTATGHLAWSPPT
jgi:hypothetical protein